MQGIKRAAVFLQVGLDSLLQVNRFAVEFSLQKHHFSFLPIILGSDSK